MEQYWVMDGTRMQPNKPLDLNHQGLQVITRCSNGRLMKRRGMCAYIYTYICIHIHDYVHVYMITYMYTIDYRHTCIAMYVYIYIYRATTWIFLFAMAQWIPIRYLQIALHRSNRFHRVDPSDEPSPFSSRRWRTFFWGLFPQKKTRKMFQWLSRESQCFDYLVPDQPSNWVIKHWGTPLGDETLGNHWDSMLKLSSLAGDSTNPSSALRDSPTKWSPAALFWGHQFLSETHPPWQYWICWHISDIYVWAPIKSH